MEEKVARRDATIEELRREGARLKEQAERDQRVVIRGGHAAPTDHAVQMEEVDLETLLPEPPEPPRGDGDEMDSRKRTNMKTDDDYRKAVKELMKMDQERAVLAMALDDGLLLRRIYNCLDTVLSKDVGQFVELLWRLSYDDMPPRILRYRTDVLVRFATSLTRDELLLVIQRMCAANITVAQREGDVRVRGSDVVLWMMSELLRNHVPQDLPWLPDAVRALGKGYTRSARNRTRLAATAGKTVLMFNTHANDPKDYVRVHTVPYAEELKTEPSAERLATWKFETRPQGCQRHIERHFRMMREDAMHEAREFFERVIRNDDTSHRMQAGRIAGASVKVHREGRGLEIEGNVDLPNTHPLICKKSSRDREQWIRDAKGFFPFGVLAVVRVTRESIVRGSKASEHFIVGWLERARDAENIAAKSVKQKKVWMQCVLRDVTSFILNPGEKYDLFVSRVEWRNVNVVLNALQGMTEQRMPFVAQLISCAPPEEVVAEPCPGVKEGSVSEMQRTALDTAFRNNVTLIQGPPGTGKTHVATQLLSSIISTGTRGVVVVVSYGNHALDQLLCRLDDMLKFKENTEVARLGRGSKEARVQRFVVDAKARVYLTRDEHSLRMEEIRKWSDGLQELIDESTIEQFFECGEVQKHKALRGLKVEERELEWMRTKANKKKKGFTFPKADPAYLLRLWKDGAEMKIEKGEPKIANCVLHNPSQARREAFNMPKDARAKIVAAMEAERSKNAEEVRKGLESALGGLDEARQSQRGRELARNGQCKVVGCTTSFASANLSMLQAVVHTFRQRGRSVTMLFEEAGETLEAHTLCCLSKDLERVVMIGDHKQLQPKVNKYDFQSASGKGYDLNCSLFERLVRGGFPLVTLDVQHRMFDSISQVVRQLAYPTLKDGGGVAGKSRKAIPGLDHQLLFVDHTFPEDGKDDTMSKVNNEEAALVVKTVAYLTHFVPAADIAVISPYLGQVQMLRAKLLEENLGAVMSDRDREELDSDGDEPEHARAQQIRVSSVDNFQGEEAKYVLVSLVRSNPSGDIGWLKERNRVTVLLSRAQEGLIVFGNKQTLCKRRGVWCEVLESGAPTCIPCAPGMTLFCPQHGTGPKVKDRSGFESVCKATCGFKLPCGHQCPQSCHRAVDPGHKHYKCKVPVEKKCDEGHLYEEQCHKRDAACPHCLEKLQLEKKAAAEAKKAEKEHQRRKLALEKQHRSEELIAENAQQKEQLAAVELDYERMCEERAHQDQRRLDELNQKIAAKEKKVREERTRIKAEERAHQQKMRDEAAALDARLIEEKAAHQQRLQEEERKQNEKTAQALDEQRREQSAAEEAAKAEGADLDREVNCAACCDDLSLREASYCKPLDDDSNKFFFHDDCFENMILAEVNDPKPDLAGEVQCQMCDDKHIIHITHLRRFLTDKAFARYTEARTSAREARAQEEREKQVRKELENETAVDRLVRELAEEANNKCPECKKVFHDFDNCSALMCRCSAKVTTHFCAFCFENCQNWDTAHAHVAGCQDNPTRPKVYHEKVVYLQFHEKRRRRLYWDRLNNEKDDVRAQVWARLDDGAPFPKQRPA
eukprot:TRINITY_DN274_c0_g1_i5.p1 TRINITY_DN274_c0_g1~~TRINITY_DN274_c0_g1_i5.p1  ORF type:complete len:1571 (+),score=417.48 TRINITY_DN274_c0_g1_i5:882-5594(+)